MKPLLKISNLCINFGHKAALKMVNFIVGEGEAVGLVGESGSGKSLTASSIMRLLPESAKITSGQIFFDGDDLVPKTQKQMERIRGRLIGKVLQDPMTSLNPVLTIGEQLIECLKYHFQLSDKQARTESIELLSQMGIRDGHLKLDCYAHELSGGQRQRVLIAIALCCKPRMLIADEPTTALDATVQAQLLMLLKERQQETKMSLLFISHDLHAVAQVCDRIIVLKEGAIVEEGEAHKILYHPQHPYTQQLVHSKNKLPLREERMFVQEKKTLVSIRNLHKSYKKNDLKVKALINTSLDIYEGETLGLAGESGCGKSTLGKCLSRLMDIDQGSIHFCGHELTMLTNTKMIPIRKDLQIIFQNPYASLNPRLTIKKIVMEPLLVHKICDHATAYQRVPELLEKVGLGVELLDRLPSQLSGGQRQRVAIARALALEPKLIICDEILSSLDASTQMEILNLLISLQKKLGLSYLFISHDLPLMGHFADRIAVMYEGKIVEQGPAQQILLNPSHPFTKQLIYSSDHH